MATMIDFQTHKLRREGLTAALRGYIRELEVDGITLDSSLALGAVIADVARLAGVETPPQVAEWLDRPVG